MPSAYTYQNNNIQRTWLLIFLFVGVTSGLFYIIGAFYGNSALGILGLVISLGQAFIAYFTGDKIALSTVRAQQVDAQQAPQIHTMVENLSKIAGIPKPKIYISPDKSANAFAAGRDPEHASICLNQGILKILNKSELEGVIAHELSHIKNRDILVMTVAMVMASAISFVADLGFRTQFWGFRDNDSESKSPVIFIVYLATILLAPLLALLIQSSISRQREFLADATGAIMTRYPDGLKNALIKLHQSPIPTSNYSTAMNHFYITPVKRTFGAKINSLFSTHPPVQDRVRALENMGGSK